MGFTQSGINTVIVTTSVLIVLMFKINRWCIGCEESLILLKSFIIGNCFCFCFCIHRIRSGIRVSKWVEARSSQQLSIRSASDSCEHNYNGTVIASGALEVSNCKLSEPFLVFCFPNTASRCHRVFTCEWQRIDAPCNSYAGGYVFQSK